MPNLKSKLETVSYAGFSVENIEVLTRQLRELTHALYAKDWSTATATAHAIQARATDLAHQTQHAADRAASR